MTKDTTLKTDIAIIGAGLVGLAAAVGLHQAGFSVVLIDAKKPTKTADIDHQIWDTRIYAISPKNAEWLKQVGVWQLLDSTRIGEMQGMVISGDTSSLILSAEDANTDSLGFIVESNALMQALIQKVEELEIHTCFDSACAALKTAIDSTTVSLSNGQTLQSALLLAADGSYSWVRQQLNMPVQQKKYDQIAIVANFKIEKSHSHIARQWFKQDAEGKSSILAYLPLPENRISIVWSVSTHYAEKLLALTNDEFTEQVKLAGDSAFGEMSLIGQPASFPLMLQKSNTLMQDCVLLIGDAAHQVHPLAGQGMNLGFRDVIDLLGILKEKNKLQSVNDSSFLKHYSRVRKMDILKMVLLTDGLYQLFESKNRVVKKVREVGLSATKYQPIKKLLVENAINL